MNIVFSWLVDSLENTAPFVSGENCMAYVNLNAELEKLRDGVVATYV